MLRACHSPSYKPPVTPAVALEVLALARRPELVAARVLRLAQSVHHSRGARILSLRDAIVRVGVQTVANLFLAETMTARVFRAPGYDAAMSSLRRHSAMTAHIADALAAPMTLHREHAFLWGLLHDVGVAAAAYLVGHRAPFAIAWPTILDAHADVGRILCRAWRLPAEIEVVVVYHHGARVGGTLHPGACLVAVAEWIAADVGFGLDGEGPSLRPETELRLLGIDDATIAAATEDAKKAAARIG